MRPAAFDASVLRRYLRRHKIADLPELKRALGTDTALTVFRKLKTLHYLASYTHRGRFYTLPDIAHFDDHGLWSHEAVWFSRYGTLLSTVEAFVLASPTATTPKNWPTSCTPRCRSLYAIWSSESASAGPKSRASICIRPSSRRIAAIKPWLVV